MVCSNRLWLILFILSVVAFSILLIWGDTSWTRKYRRCW